MKVEEKNVRRTVVLVTSPKTVHHFVSILPVFCVCRLFICGHTARTIPFPVFNPTISKFFSSYYMLYLSTIFRILW